MSTYQKAAVKYAEDIKISADLAGKHRTNAPEKERIYRAKIALLCED
jgi:hypothetical protein